MHYFGDCAKLLFIIALALGKYHFSNYSSFVNIKSMDYNHDYANIIPNNQSEGQPIWENLYCNSFSNHYQYSIASCWLNILLWFIVLVSFYVRLSKLVNVVDHSNACPEGVSVKHWFGSLYLMHIIFFQFFYLTLWSLDSLLFTSTSSLQTS